MEEQIVALCRQLGAGEDDALLSTLARAARQELEGGLRPGVAPEDCGDAFPMAVALTVLALLEEMGEGDVTAFTAGDVTIRREGRGSLARCARMLLSPWQRDRGFCFREVPG